ncbi:MAG: class I SAM-dependent methyltransferase [Candidatus Levybacteria bacterium]|nr:class I SAM-dependent methyltransferase [Candidatus Levybacteria bacterium]
MTHSHHYNVTRGFGFLETVLAKKRAAIAQELIDPAKRSGRVLDIGCGSFPYFLTTTHFSEKYGVDGGINESLFHDLTIKLKKLNVETERLPFKNDFFDVVVMLAVFEHIHPQFIDKVLVDIFHTLKKDGQLIITTPSQQSVPVLWTLSRIGLISKVEIDDHKNSYALGKIKSFLTHAGFQSENIASGRFELGFNMWFVARK